MVREVWKQSENGSLSNRTKGNGKVIHKWVTGLCWETTVLMRRLQRRCAALAGSLPRK